MQHTLIRSRPFISFTSHRWSEEKRQKKSPAENPKNPISDQDLDNDEHISSISRSMRKILDPKTQFTASILFKLICVLFIATDYVTHRLIIIHIDTPSWQSDFRQIRQEKEEKSQFKHTQYRFQFPQLHTPKRKCGCNGFSYPLCQKNSTPVRIAVHPHTS